MIKCLTVMVNRNVEMFLHLSTTARRAVGNDNKAQSIICCRTKKIVLGKYEGQASLAPKKTCNIYSVLERAVSEIKMLIMHQFV